MESMLNYSRLEADLHTYRPHGGATNHAINCGQYGNSYDGVNQSLLGNCSNFFQNELNSLKRAVEGRRVDVTGLLSLPGSDVAGLLSPPGSSEEEDEDNHACSRKADTPPPAADVNMSDNCPPSESSMFSVSLVKNEIQDKFSDHGRYTYS